MNIFVGRLSYETQESNLRALFEQIGQVKSLKIITDRETGKSKGFAFVTMASHEDGQKAVTQLDGTALDGRNISVSEAEDRKSNERKPTAGPGQGQRSDFKPRREESRDEEDSESGGKPEKSSRSSEWSDAPSKGAPRKNSPNKKKKEAPTGRGGDDEGFRKKKMPPKPPKSKKNRGWGEEDDDDDIFGDFKF
ncbi:RNA recognition motif domain-containing protein [Roseivirga echinicomitans]|uniref:RNA recognition motif domain-containing protein n=1 Tax=Roseivirga echinicomitans TaxID=296218 RepID=UPI000A00FAD5|nr:RNA-binding protein [Roseivirga echinicomitans]